MDENLIKVYVKLDNNNIIKEINSSIFIGDATGYIVIDEGTGDKYSHARGNYLEKGLIDINGKYNYKLVDGNPIELTEEEKTSLFPAKAPEPTQDDILRSKILKDGMVLQMQMTQQQNINANLLAQIAKLTGGTNNG